MLSGALAWVSGLLLLGSPPHRATTVVGRLAAAPAPSVSVSASASSLVAPAVVPPLPVPPLNVVMLLVGTLGDLLPFMAIARRMEQEHGHTVRIATHEVHRARVRAHGLRFYPLAGDPVELSEWAQTFSCAPTDLVECCAHPQLTAAKASMQRDICFSTWPACTAPDEESGEPFQADAIIANPPTYGHIHCAERLGVPLHLMFPQVRVRLGLG